jgi:adenosylmethionine-8-amino-7-oxononanoate aminotransferase
VAAALAALDVYADEEHPGHGPGGRCDPAPELAALVASRPFLRQPRVAGMMAAIDLSGHRKGGRWTRSCVPAVAGLPRGRGTRRAAAPARDTMYLFPPLNTRAEDLRAMVAVLAESVDAVLERDRGHECR